MNGKKARKLRRLAVEIAQAVAGEANQSQSKVQFNALSADPVRVYKELKNIDKSINGK